MYAVPFRGATVAMAAVPRRVVYTAWCISGRGRRKKKEVKMRRNARNYAPCGFDQTFPKFDAWCESTLPLSPEFLIFFIPA
ncbi:hypothetical protein CW714_05150 [Methanophagales archaeon]|nr:MAG: hypothetical protein CW714_05150 [Methanophagales archaeon]